jgi:plasmid rolling circle replication initiator protein Rep
MPIKHGKPPSNYKLLTATLLKSLWTKHKQGKRVKDVDAFRPLSFGLFSSYQIMFNYIKVKNKLNPHLSVFYGVSSETEDFKNIDDLLADNYIGERIAKKQLYIRPD